MDKNNEIVKELNDFLRGIHMGYDTFKIYEDKAQDKYLKDELSKVLSTFTSQKAKIISYIDEFNGDAKDSLGIGGEVASMFEKLKDIFMNNDEEILNNALKAMDMGIKSSEKVIFSLDNISTDKSIVNTIDNMVNEYKILFDKLNKLKNRIKS